MALRDGLINFVQENRITLRDVVAMKGTCSVLSAMLPVVITVVLPVMTAAKHDGTKMGICGTQGNVPLTEKKRINSGFKIPLFNG
jgi:hypothetical protein